MRDRFLVAVLAATSIGAACASAPKTPPAPEASSEAAPPGADEAPPTDAEELAAGGGHPGGSPEVRRIDPARALEAALRHPDPHARAASLETLHEVFGGHPQLSEIIASVLVQTYAELLEIEKMREWSRKVQVRDDTSYADVLNAMAYAYAELGEHLAEGLIRVEQGLAILDRLTSRLEAHGEQPAPGGPLEARRAAFLDTRGWLHFKMEKVALALEDLIRADELMDDPEIHWHRCVVLEKLERRGEAAAACADALVHDERFADEARARLSALTEDPEGALTAARARSAKRRSETILRRSIDRPTPRLELLDQEGNALPLGGEERPGAIQVFWLWATWCKPCLDELPLLEAVAGREENREVRFLAVNVDQDPELVHRFLQRRALSFPVAYGDAHETLRALNVGGLPALFVRDAAGRIRFVHLGADPAIGEILQAEIDALQSTP
ncbi:MAG: redoxin family protein [Deltaproteobacteria bacterium]|nr:redoxin family protein [Deltaproteobacteria bacterium]